MAYGVSSRKFFCCLPVRFGVFILSLLQFVSSGVLAGLMYWAITKNGSDLDSNYRIIAAAVAAVSTLLAVVSLLGFIGSLMRRQNLIKIFSIALNFLVALSILADVAAVVILFVYDKSEIIKDCIDSSDDPSVIDSCQNIDLYRGVSITMLAIDTIVGLYACYIVSSYVKQLQEEKEARWRRSAMKTWDDYEQVPRRDSGEAFHPSSDYPYNEKNHSYGSHHV